MLVIEKLHQIDSQTNFIPLSSTKFAVGLLPAKFHRRTNLMGTNNGGLSL